MKIHDVKCWPSNFKSILDNKKTFDVRKRDSYYQIGDLLNLREWYPITGEFTGACTMRRIIYILQGDMFGIKEGYCILGFGNNIVNDSQDEVAKKQRWLTTAPGLPGNFLHAVAARPQKYFEGIKMTRRERITHELKCWPKHFQDVWDGKKNFEVRKCDRDYQVNDTIDLKEYDPVLKAFTGRGAVRKITCILRGGVFGIEEGFCVLGFEYFSLVAPRGWLTTAHRKVKTQRATIKKLKRRLTEERRVNDEQRERVRDLLFENRRLHGMNIDLQCRIIDLTQQVNQLAVQPTIQPAPEIKKDVDRMRKFANALEEAARQFRSAE